MQRRSTDLLQLTFRKRKLEGEYVRLSVLLTLLYLQLEVVRAGKAQTPDAERGCLAMLATIMNDMGSADPNDLCFGFPFQEVR